VQKYISKGNIKSLINSLRIHNEYNFFYGTIIRALFITKRFGFIFKAAQMKYFLYVVIFLFFSAVSIIGLYSIGIPEYSGNTEQQVKPLERFDTKTNNNTSHKVTTKSEIKTRLGIEKFTSDTVTLAVLETITDAISDNLTRTKGEDKIVNLRYGKKDKYINRILLGSVRKLGDAYIITTRIIDVEKSSVIFATDETVSSEAEINSACLKIAEKVSQIIE
jgi:hypothetical protein